LTAAPLIAAVPAFLLLDEPVHVAIVAGGAMIVAAGASCSAASIWKGRPSGASVWSSHWPPPR
jgi:drug/metabolite transporter (DMT)-like permease